MPPAHHAPTRASHPGPWRAGRSWPAHPLAWYYAAPYYAAPRYAAPYYQPAAQALAPASCPEGYARSLAAPYACEPLPGPARAGLDLAAVAVTAAALIAGFLLGRSSA